MANRIVGLDIGTYAVKAVTIELQRQLEVVDYREIPLDEVEEVKVTVGADGTVEEGAPQAGPGQQAPDAESGPGEQAGESGDPQQAPGGDWADAPDTSGDGGDEQWSDAGFEGAGDDDGPSQWEEPKKMRQTWVSAIAKLKRDGFFEDVGQVITSFPNGKAITLHVDVPFERTNEVREILPHLLSDHFPFSLGEVVYDFIVVPGKGPDLWEALVGFVRREEMAQFLGRCKQAGVDPAVVGVPELMLRYAGDQAVSPGVESYAIIDIGHRFTRLLIMSEGKPVVAHTAQKGGAAITEALSENFQISSEQAKDLKHREGVVGSAARGGDRRVRQVQGTIEGALRSVVRDLRRTFQAAYAKYQVAVDEIYICGGTSRLQGIDDYLAGEFEVDVEPLRFDEGIVWNVGAESRGRMAEAALALGNALQRPLDESDAKLIDFRQEEFVYRGKSSYLHTQMVRLGAIGAVLLLMLVGVLFVQHHDQRAQLQAMQVAFAEQTQELFGERVSNPNDIQARLEGDAAADRAFIPQMSAYELMVRIVDEMDEEIPLKLDRFEVDTDRSLIQIVGETDSPQSVDVLASQIERLECLNDVSKDQVNVQGDDQVQFELQVSSACS